MHTLIFDTDIGVDDAFALAYAARTQRLLGITTVFGNVAVGQAVKKRSPVLRQDADRRPGLSRLFAPVGAGTQRAGEAARRRWPG
ncbi:nucleoside hydrolase [Pantoea tagorei]